MTQSPSLNDWGLPFCLGGKAIRFTDDIVIRYAKNITARETELEVEFKTGIKVTSNKEQAA